MSKQYPMIEYFPMGGPTKEAEYARTVQMLQKQLNTNKRDLMLALYLLADSGYQNKDLYSMAKMMEGRPE